MNNKKINKILTVLLLVVSIFLLYEFNTTNTKAELDGSAWDGESVALNFLGGSGTKDNPYLISNANEFIYFKNILASDDSYLNLYYKLTGNINLGNNKITSIENFSGVIDGNGYAIYNILIEDRDIEEGLFRNFKGTLKNIEIKNIKSNLTKSNSYLISDKLTNAKLENIIISGEVSTTVTDGNSYIIAKEITNSKLNNIYLDTNGTKLYETTTDSEYTKVFSQNEVENTTLYKEDSIDTLNEDNTYTFTYNEEGMSLSINSNNSSYNLLNPIRAPLLKSPMTNVITLHNSGVEDDTVYINDLDSDYYYYKGLNYTSGTTSTDYGTPTMDNKNYYNDSNLVRVQITYDGTFNNKTGYISYDEEQSKLVYYKYYPVDGNSITIDLIDNPFAGRPDDYVFNGWITEDNDITLSLDSSYFTRKATIPVSYSGGKPKDINVTFTASWLYHPAATVSRYSDINSAINALDSAGFVKVDAIEEIYSYKLSRDYYTYTELNLNESAYGYLNEYGNPYSESDYCYRTGYGGWWGYDYYNCDAYTLHEAGEEYDPNLTYYQLGSYGMSQVSTPSYDTELVERRIDPKYDGINMAGFYTGPSSTTSSCTNYNGCGTFTLLNYYDSNGNENIFDENKTYYYFVTRDTNIVYLDTGTGTSWSSTKPFTLTSYYNGIDRRNNAYYNMNNSYIKAYTDTRVEYVKLYTTSSISSSGSANSSSNSAAIYGNLHNLKIGRGITNNGSYRNAYYVAGGNNSGTKSDSKYHLIVESGDYYFISATDCNTSTNTTFDNPLVIATYGNDYDRVKNNKDDLKVYETTMAHYYNNLNGDNATFGVTQIVKSGTFGSGLSATDYTQSIYVSGLYGSMATTKLRVIVEGGYVNTLNGGPGTKSSQQNISTVYIYMKGGEVGSLFGGAGRVESYGNRIIQATGGKVDYGLFGASNGSSTVDLSNMNAQINDDTYLYLGGNFEAGDETLVSNEATRYDVTAGSVFGIGAGRSSSTNVGSAENSYIIVNDNATIRGNIYGGGNFAATGITSTGSSCETKIKLLGGTVLGSVYGGGNQNGTGSSNILGEVNITLDGGSVRGSIYGGSNISGIIYGDTIINLKTGSVNTGVYGGGEGNNTGVEGNVLVNVGVNGETDNSKLTINKVYGGSAFGVVNGSSSTANRNATTKVNVYSGTVTGDVFGGAEGDNTYTPHVYGDVIVDVLGGNIGRVFGGNDKKGYPELNSTVLLHGGVVGNAFGGGNATSQPQTFIYLDGSTIVNNLFGGSNTSGTVNESSVVVLSGEASSIYGGNNEGGSTTLAKVRVYDGEFGSVYGGSKGSGASSGTTYVYFNGGDADNIYGGGNAASTTESFVYANKNGDDPVGNIFGGGNAATVSTTHVYLNGTDVTNVYGGGNQAGATTTNVNLYNGEITNIYGGANQSGNVTTSNILNATSNNLPSDFNTLTPYKTISEGESETYSNDGNVTPSINISQTSTTEYTVTLTYTNNTNKQMVGVDGYANVYVAWQNSNSFRNGYYVDSTSSSPNLYTNIRTRSSNSRNKYITLTIDYETTSEISIPAHSTSSIYFVIKNSYSPNLGALPDYTSRNNLSHYKLKDIIIGQGYPNYIPTLPSVTLDEPSDYESITTEGIGVTSSLNVMNYNPDSTYRNYVEVSITATNNTSSDLNDYVASIFINDPNAVLADNWGGANITHEDGMWYFDEVSLYNPNAPITIYANQSRTVTFHIYTNKEASDIGIVTSSNNNFVKVDNIYGGNNQNGLTSNANIILLKSGSYGNIYGGGNYAPTGVNNISITNIKKINNVYGGGNNSTTNTNANVSITNTNIHEDVYGGGNRGNVNSNTTVNIVNTKILGSAFGGGNAASVNGKSIINVSGNTKINGNLFAGGNSGTIGAENSITSSATVNVTGLDIGGNIYGGCNTSVVNGNAVIRIGSAVSDDTMAKGDIIINGTVFGGGEANSSGDANFDFKSYAVMNGTDVKIDGESYLDNGFAFTLKGSIFGSGNALLTKGDAIVYLANIGSITNISRNISIQRATRVTMDNVVMELSGAEDSTNDYSSVKYSLNRIDELILVNSSTLLVRENANMLKSFKSMSRIKGVLVNETVTINDGEHVVTNGSVNRVLIRSEKVLNVTTNQQATAYGVVSGMAFMGMYNVSSTGSISMGLYSSEYDNGDAANAGLLITGGTYILGLHSENHDITKDGFYTNSLNQDGTRIVTDYVVPTPPEAEYYMWAIGVQTDKIEITLEASKYSSLGTLSQPMSLYPYGGTEYRVVGFNADGLLEGVEVVDSSIIPKIAPIGTEPDQKIGLSMKAETSEWTFNGSTDFFSTNHGSYDGTTYYKNDITNSAPKFNFYLYHSKNIRQNKDLGNVVITLQVKYPKNEFEYELKYLRITVNINTIVFDLEDAYDASITYGKKYDFPAATDVNITKNSQFTAYFSLFTDGDPYVYGEVGEENTYKRVLTLTKALAPGTNITLIDSSSDKVGTNYYYYTITEADYNYFVNTLSYDAQVELPFSKFIRMDSTDSNNHYDDHLNDILYYYEDEVATNEEFLFIFDFANANVDSSLLNVTNNIGIELQKQNGTTLRTTLGIKQEIMKYTLYENSNINLSLNVTTSEGNIRYDQDYKMNLAIEPTYPDAGGGVKVVDTNYESSNMGLNITLVDSMDTQMSGDALSGASITYDGNVYHADATGVFRIKVGEKVSKTTPKLTFNTTESLPVGDYTIFIKVFASQDGLHDANDMASNTREIPVTLLSNDNVIKVSVNDKSKIVHASDGKTLNGSKNIIVYIASSMRLRNPNLRLEIQRRSVNSIDSTSYSNVTYDNLFSTNLTLMANSGVFGLVPINPNEYFVTNNIDTTNSFTYTLADNPHSGTYRLVYSLYDNNQLIDSDEEYIIVLEDEVSN